MRCDWMLGLVRGKAGLGEEFLAGKGTLNRLELSTSTTGRYKKIAQQSDALVKPIGSASARSAALAEFALDISIFRDS